MTTTTERPRSTMRRPSLVRKNIYTPPDVWYEESIHHFPFPRSSSLSSASLLESDEEQTPSLVLLSSQNATSTECRRVYIFWFTGLLLRWIGCRQGNHEFIELMQSLILENISLNFGQTTTPKEEYSQSSAPHIAKPSYRSKKPLHKQTSPI